MSPNQSEDEVRRRGIRWLKAKLIELFHVAWQPPESQIAMPSRKESLEDLDPPIHLTELRQLFESLDQASIAGIQCDHSFALTEKFLSERGIPASAMLQWLGQNGAGCDCEVMINTAANWSEIVGFQSADDIP